MEVKKGKDLDVRVLILLSSIFGGELSSSLFDCLLFL